MQHEVTALQRGFGDFSGSGTKFGCWPKTPRARAGLGAGATVAALSCALLHSDVRLPDGSAAPATRLYSHPATLYGI